jgi:hypothetical protein
MADLLDEAFADLDDETGGGGGGGGGGGTVTGEILDEGDSSILDEAGVYILDEEGVLGEGAVAALVGEGVLAAVSEKPAVGTGVFAGGAVLTAAATREAGAVLGGAGTLTAVAGSAGSGAGTGVLAGGAVLTAAATRETGAVLAGTGTLTAMPGGQPPLALTYAAQVPAAAGLAVAMSPPGGTTGDVAPTGASIALLVANGGVSPVTVTLPVAPTVDGLTVASRAVLVPGHALVLIPLPGTVYGTQPTRVTYSSVLSVTTAVIGLA